MQNHYEINVSLRGIHFFATAARSLTDADHAVYVFGQLRARFPKSEGYEVTATYWSGSGERMDW